MNPERQRFVLKALLATSVTALSLLAICAVSLYRAVYTGARGVAIEDIGPEDRQRLVKQLLEVAGDACLPAWFEPRIGYTLKPDQDLDVWGDAFHSNELGYRSPRSLKTPGVLRVLFVGDSWTYGMGASFADSLPKQFELLANRLISDNPKYWEVEAWSLALPGYNTLNEVAALEFFFDRLEPDLVVQCPTRNDADSSHIVLPNGSLGRLDGDVRDDFGDDHSLAYLFRFIDSYRYEERWRRAFVAMRETERWLTDRGVPYCLAFIADWEPAFVHRWVAEVGLQAPYMIAPLELKEEAPWTGPLPWKHGSPACYQLLARMVYRLVRPPLSWRELDLDPEHDALRAEYFERPPAGDLRAASRAAIDRWIQEVPTSWAAGGGGGTACAGPMNFFTGLMHRRTTVLVRRRAGAERLLITVARLEQKTRLYPLQLSVRIPSAAGGSAVDTVVSADGPRQQRVTVALPSDIPPDSVLDVEFRVDRVTSAPDVSAPRSLYILAIEQQ